MSKRLRSIERIVAVQKQKLALAEWKIFHVQREQAALLQDQNELQRLLEADPTPGSNLALLAIRTGRRMAAATARLHQAETLAIGQMHNERRQLKLGERILTQRNLEERHDQEKQSAKDLFDHITQYKI